MRIAISGSHLVGKTTLAEALVEALPEYQLVPEPYYLLEDDGHVFAETPGIEDFELQLERSVECVQESGVNVVFDRCPLDFLGYLITHPDADVFRLEDWMPRIQESVALLDTIIFVPIEKPDRIDLPRPDGHARAEVDAALTDILPGDVYGLEFDCLVVSGTVAERVRRVVAHID